MKEYKVFLEKGEELKENEEIEIEVKDLTSFDTNRVRAIVSSRPEELPGADRLWLQFEGHYEVEKQHPWAIKILEVFEEEVKEVEIAPKAPPPLRGRGDLLRSLIREREEKEGEEG
jgi:hypothetical protein